MAPKKTRIIKGEWQSFIRDFNRQNQFRLATFVLGENTIIGGQGAVFVGLSYEPKANKMEVYFGGQDAAHPLNLAHTINGPRAVYLVNDYEADNPVIGLNIQGAPGSRTAYLAFAENSPGEGRRHWTSCIAYHIYENRGMACGLDQQDWYEAESVIEDVSRRFLKG
ncbi:DUF2934 domain-containing protein [Dissulfurimicrobium hydrothermale]|uniref:DUF2934 domain-containing protein n=1 Tax=Dissulfurimicrobium hydrothermale TaxID=1750598 RepID=UPI001EDAEC5B|nr:DUF2934 domain-containing protein [Dissulfurimicrobium hydrothermale]UKL13031.1 DUF2934 domain-containing protein [Dissulfurimicrobium hydrothermale]